MFNFSLKDMYDDRVSTYLMIISLCKWIGIFFIAAGLFLAIWFSQSWLAIIGGIFITIIGFLAAIICHFLRKKLDTLATIGGNLVSNMESAAKHKAMEQLNKMINKEKNTH